MAVSVSRGRHERPLCMAPGSPSADRIDADPYSRGWLTALRAEGPVREEALAALHALLVRAARFEVARRRASLRDVGAVELEAIAVQSADDALVAVLAKLDQFRGASRF